MLRFTLILLIALLPLRGLTADRMFLNMAFDESASQSMEMSTSQGSMPEDCPMMAKSNLDNSELDGEGKAESRHQVCQLCMFLAATDDSAIKHLHLFPQPYETLPTERFASAELLPLTKPPIY